MESLEATAYVPVEDSAKNGKKFNLNGVKPGTLNTDNSSAQAAQSAESLGGTVNLHKVAKTGSYDDLNNKPTIPSSGYSRVTLNDLEPTNRAWQIPVHNRESVTAYPVNYTNQNKLQFLVDDACDDAIVCVNVPAQAASSITTIDVFRAPNKSLTTIYPIREVYDYTDDVLMSTIDGGSGAAGTPTDWEDVGISPRLPKYYDDKDVFMMVDPNTIANNGISKVVVRIVADVAYVNYVPM